VETRISSSPRCECLPAPKTHVPGVLAGLCCPAFLDGSELPDFDDVFATYHRAVLVLAVGSLAFQAVRRRGLTPFWAGVVATALILSGKFNLEVAPVAYVGVGMLILASVWNTWPRRPARGSCTACAPTEGGLTVK